MFAPRSSNHYASARGPDSAGGRSRRGFYAALSAVLTLLVIAVAAPGASAQQQNWPCSAFGYLFQTRTGATSTEIVEVDIATGAQNQIATTQSPTPGTHTVNAVGYNVVDGFFYGMRSLEIAPGVLTWSLVRVNRDGTLDELGVPTGPGGTVDAAASYPIGEVDLNGHYWISNGVTWYEIDLNAAPPTVLQSGAWTSPAGITGMGNDWSYVNGALYTFGAVAGGGTNLVRFNPATGTFSNLGPIGAGGFGASFSDASGYVYGSQNTTGDIYRIDPTTRQTIPASQAGEVSPGNDGARCANAVVPTITVTKTVNGRVRAADQFTVGLRRPDGSLATSATTSGSATTASTVNFPASQGRTYTITDAMAAGSPTPLDQYAKSIACRDADGNPAATGGSGPTWTLNVAAATFYTCNVTNSAVADLRLEKTASPTPVVPGEDVTFELKVTNDGPSTSIGETVTDDLPDSVTFSAASAGCSEAAGTVTCAVGTLAAGASKTFTITGRVASDLDRCLENTGTVTGRFDPDTSNNAMTICKPIRGRSNLSIAKDPSSPTVTAGGQVMYTLVVRNHGPSDDPTAEVSDPMAAGLTLVSARPSQGTCSTASNTVDCDLGRLRDGGSAQVLVTATTRTTPLGCITNTASVRGAHEDPNTDNNRDSARICLDPPPPARFDLEVSKRANDRTVVVGQPVSYRIVVRNNGPEAAPDVRITDTLNAPGRVVRVRSSQGSCERRLPMRCELGTIAAGASVTITVVVKHRESGCRPGQRQAASATGDGTDVSPANNMDTVDVCVRKVRLRLSKVASSSTVQAGGTLSYRIRVRNPTKGEASNVRVCDRLPSGMRFVSSSPRAQRRGGQRCWTIKRLGARKSKSYRVTVRVARGANGRKVNRATATGAGVRGVQARSPVRVRGAQGGVTG